MTKPPLRSRSALMIILACLCLPPLFVGGLLKAGQYQFMTWRVSSSYPSWFVGHTYMSIDERPVPSYAVALFRHGIAAYRPQDVPPPCHYLVLTARILDPKGHGISWVSLSVYDLAGKPVDDPSLVVHYSGQQGMTYQYLAEPGLYDVVAGRPGYLPIKKRVVVGPKGTFVKFVLPRALPVDVPARRLPASARS